MPNIHETLTFQTVMRGHHHGQSDLRLSAYDAGEYVGYIDYSVYQGKPQVQMIEVPEKRRRGYATAMVQHLQSEFPDTEIEMSGSTPAGTELLSSIPQTVTDEPDYQSTLRRLQQVQAKLAQYAALADAGYTDEVRQATADWNDLHQEEWNLEQDLRGMRPSKRLFHTNLRP